MSISTCVFNHGQTCHNLQLITVTLQGDKAVFLFLSLICPTRCQKCTGNRVCKQGFGARRYQKAIWRVATSPKLLYILLQFIFQPNVFQQIALKLEQKKSEILSEMIKLQKLPTEVARLHSLYDGFCLNRMDKMNRIIWLTVTFT